MHDYSRFRPKLKKQGLLGAHQLEKKNRKNHIEDSLNDPLAIIGMNCQFPGVDADVEDVTAFHAMLMNGLTAIKEVPENRWDAETYYDADRKKADKIISRMGGFLKNPHLFDTDFFKISPIEAKQIDPQHRLFLEVSIRALNHANIRLDSINGSNTGVYCGISSQDYSQLNYKDNIQFNEYTQIGVAASGAPGRLSHFLNLKGPGMVVDTACSSSLSALYIAAAALRLQQCHMAIVGGVHLNLCPENFIGLTKANMLSASGKCSSFDSKADGFVRSEGCGVIIVKRLSDAIKDNNRIYAVIKSIVMNQDGDGPGLTAPNKEAQIAMHEAALMQANVSASDIDYIETHGTGTIIGDSVEFNAIQSIHQGHHSKDNPLIIGALKSNLGHTISSSGIASLIKVICALEHETIPPNLHYSTPNSLIDPDSIPALLPVQATAFTKQKNKKRYAQISNFGFSGTNVSLIVEEPPKAVLKPSNTDEPACFVMSSNSESALQQLIATFARFLKTSPSSLNDICLSLINARDHFKFRCAIIAPTKEALLDKIETNDYEVRKVVIKKDIQIIANDVQQIYEAYLSGINLRVAVEEAHYNQVELPLYVFDRKPYWHTPRKNTTPVVSWLDVFYQQSKEQQVETIKAKVSSQIQVLLQKETIDDLKDFESLGFTEPLLQNLDQILQDMFSPRYKIPASLSSAHLTVDKLARHLQQIIIPATVQRQPSINVLHTEPIAIIGMSCRFPKAPDIDAFLSLLEKGESGMSDIPLERWDNEKYYDADVNALGRLYIKQLGFIDNVKNFDADFFNISPREAKLMSPQLRVFMETSYHALEHANLSLDSIKDSNTGVFVGCGTNEYPRVLGNQGVTLEDLNIYFATGNVLNALAGRVAYAFDFHGPIQAIDTACSSSMTAIHNACLSLQSGDCNMALAGGVNILLIPDSNITLSKARMLSPDSRCKTFSEDADGYARSEGCGIVVLKRLSTALKDKDTIFAVIKGSSINSDGKSGGFTVPNATAQEEVIRSTLAKSKLSPGDIDYIEAHGTGTPVADPIEVNALTKIFGESHSKDKPLYLGSVKTNIGHCESASGVAGVIKAVLSLQAQKIFKHLNFTKLNPGIELQNTIIPLSTIDWPKDQGLRYAGVSSFGFSGANAHIVLEQAVVATKEKRTTPQESLLVLSAKSKVSLELLLSSYQRYLSGTTDEFADICYTAATCRSHFLFRVAIKASSAKQAAAIIAKKEFILHQVKKEKDSLRLPLTLDELETDYVNGISLNWLDYYMSLNTRFEKVKLPLYTFARVEHWFKDKNKLKDAALPKDWCFQLQWQPQPATKSQRNMQSKHWLFIGDKQWASGFTEQGLSIFFEEDDYAIEKLGGIIFAEGFEPKKANDFESTSHYQKAILKKLLAIVKAFEHQTMVIQLIVLTSNAIAEMAVGPLNMASSPLIGFCKTLVLELPQYKTILIDLDKTNPDRLSQRVLDEIHYNHGEHYEHVIAYRDGQRMVPRLRKTVLKDKKRSLEGKGRYLITGGCGGLGLITAQALLSAGARELILVSRTVDTPTIKAAIKKIQADYNGRLIRVISLDIVDKEKLRDLFLESNADGLLKGIIHAAGTAIKAPLIEHNDDSVDYLFSAKVKGGWYLHELSKDCDLDFFVVYSSVSSTFGSNKESVYSAANSFLDALIAERQRLGLVGTAIQWGPWGEVGMANSRSRDQSLKQALINNEQGQALIKVLINGQLDNATIISPDYLKFMLDFVPRPMPAFHKGLVDDLVVIEHAHHHNLSSWLSDYLELGADKRLNACKDMLSSICKEILELSETDDLDEEEGFFEIGFDSLMITEMASELKARLKPTLDVTVNIGFDYPSISKLSEYIESELDNHFVKKHAPSPKQAEDSIAIIGMSCSFPNAADIAAFEALLEEGLSGIRDIPVERWDNRKYYDPDKEAPGKSYVDKLGLIDNIKSFDASFFGISPREAKLMEPQQRIFLECSYKALENANYTPEALRESLTGVFAGVGSNEYYALLEKSGFSNEELSAYSITGNVLNLIPGRVAYTFDFKGPSLSIDTACSSSLVAVHYACQSLKNGETDYALAGGVNILLMPESNITLCKAKALSPDGLCKTFDAQADGYVRGEGCGVIFLKRLSDALRDNDHIFAVIKASAVNNDGKSAGLTVPNGKSQEEVMMTALAHTDLSDNDISYIEAHGTGTPLGDPIEVHAINKVYGSQRTNDNPLYLGTVKTNIGHLEPASGIAGLIKTVIGLQKKKIYKHLNFHHLNPNIQLKGSCIALQNTDWNTTAKRRSAGVNAFGFSGTNAHVILQEFPVAVEPRLKKAAKIHILVLSAQSKNALDRLVSRYQHYLATTTEDFGDICFTAASCREHYDYRLAVVAKDAAQASRLLDTGQFALSHGENNTLSIADEPALQSLLTTYLRGDKIDWKAYYKTGGDTFIKVRLPHYTFNRSEFWPDKKSSALLQTDSMHPLLGQMLSMPGNEYLFSNRLDLENLTYINQHCVFNKVVFPATAYIETGLAAAKAILKRNRFCIEKFNIERPLYPKQGQEFQLQVKPKNDEGFKVNIFAKLDGNWQLFSEMEFSSSSPVVSESIDINALKATFGDSLDLSQVYDRLQEKSLFYGEEFKVLQEGYVKQDSLLTHVILTKASLKPGYYYHPVLLDGAMQSILLSNSNNIGNTTYVPYAFRRMTTFQEAPRSLWVHLTRHESIYENELCFNLKLYDNAGMQVAAIEELRFRAVTQTNFISYESCLQHLYYSKWIALNLDLQPGMTIPDLWVISKDPEQAKKIVGNFNYQLIEDIDAVVDIENKNIVYLYEQGQFNALFRCCQTLFNRCPKSFILVTENAYAVSDNAKVNPYHTMVSSFWKSFRNELGLNKNYLIDIDANNSLIAVLKYIFNAYSAENQFVVRDKVFVPRLKKKQLMHHQAQEKPLFDSEACYLITGGTGGLASVLIDYLIHRGVKDIIITSRSEKPGDIKALIKNAEQKQVCISHYQADVSDYQQMEQIIESILQGSKPLKGVFHLAGLVKDGLIVNLNDDDSQPVLSAKMDGALILHQLTKNIELDMFVLFSSSASMLGAKGQSNYAAANGFLDGLAHLRRQLGLPAISINWGPFHTRGMTVNLTQALQQHGFILLDKDSMDILDLLLTNQVTQISPCPIHWESYFKHAPKPIELSELITNTAPADQNFINSLRQSTREACVAMLAQALCEISADVLALDTIEQITAKDDLFSMGMDSLMALEIRNRIHDKLQCPTLSLSIEYFINDPSIDTIARKIADELDPVFHGETANPEIKDTSIEEVALCDFQYLFWALNKLKYGFNIGMQLQLHGKLNKEYLIQAFDFVVKQNPAFWIQFNEDTPIQKAGKCEQFTIIYNDISLSNETNELNNEFNKNIVSLIPLTQQPLIRIYLYKVNNDLHELHIVIPHIIVDDVSCDIILNQFKKNYETLAQRKKLIQVPAKTTYFNYVENNNRHYEKNLQDKINFWQMYNKDFQLLNLGQAYHLPDSSNQQKHLFHYPLAARSIERFIDWHKTKNMNVSTGLIAACQLVFCKMSQQDKIPVILIHSGREGSQYKSVVGLFSEYKRINLSLNQEHTFIDCVAAVEAELVKTTPYQKCSHFIKDSGLKGSGLSIGQYLSFKWNNLFLMKYFKASKLHSRIINYYLMYLSQITSQRRKISIKRNINQLLNLNIPLQKPDGLRVLISITPSFFATKHQDMQFADLRYSFPSHFGCMDRPIGNRTLWIYFSKNQSGGYQLSINGPLTEDCKDQLARHFSKIIAEFVENNERNVADLIREF